MTPINLSQKFSLFNEYWNPKIAGELNDSYVKLAKLKGEFDWHHHDNEDELFLVVKGQLLMKFKEKDVLVNEGEIIIVPKGIEHKPVAEKEAHILLIEPKTTLNTGTTVNERTRRDLDWI